MADDGEERTEEATQQRRDDFRKRGQVAQTRELGSVLMLLSSALILWALGRFFLEQVSLIVTESLTSFLVEAARNGDYKPAVIFVTKKAVFILAPLLGILGVMSVAATVVQVGFLNNEEALEFKLDKLNPVAGFGRIFSLRSLVEGIKSILKLTLVIAVVSVLVKDQIVQVPLLISFSVNQLVLFMGDLTLRLLGGVGIFMAIVAAADYFFQRWELEKQMRMTKQEIKEEHKSREGDPMIKARIRRIQREMANKRMMADVPKADVVITNPTHIACALRYDPDNMAAPILVAKGGDRIAEKIKEIARANNVPVMENKPLARAIFKTLKVGQVIPRELFTAVAQVLSYVYKLKRKVRI
ncbi:MAG TPA: flagellar biosynthesis protein FlhB [Bdellovibrionales bacterium]|nr:flagellar biosynthesis protein FlhB [Bdellovibrionales bacterium]